jgi:hypothetical protein
MLAPTFKCTSLVVSAVVSAVGAGLEDSMVLAHVNWIVRCISAKKTEGPWPGLDPSIFASGIQATRSTVELQGHGPQGPVLYVNKPLYIQSVYRICVIGLGPCSHMESMRCDSYEIAWAVAASMFAAAAEACPATTLDSLSPLLAALTATLGAEAGPDKESIVTYNVSAAAKKREGPWPGLDPSIFPPAVTGGMLYH